MEEKKEQVTLSWVGEHLEVLQLVSKLQNEGCDVKSYLRDHIDGKPKDPAYYWGKQEGKNGNVKGKERRGKS